MDMLIRLYEPVLTDQAPAAAAERCSQTPCPRARPRDRLDCQALHARLGQRGPRRTRQPPGEPFHRHPLRSTARLLLLRRHRPRLRRPDRRGCSKLAAAASARRCCMPACTTCAPWATATQSSAPSVRLSSSVGSPGRPRSKARHPASTAACCGPEPWRTCVTHDFRTLPRMIRCGDDAQRFAPRHARRQRFPLQPAPAAQRDL